MRCLLLLLTHMVLSSLCVIVLGREVPMEKAIPPLMDPIPTLPEITHRAYFTIAIDGIEKGTIVFGLFGHHAPKAVQNFVTLSTCNNNDNDKNDKASSMKVEGQQGQVESQPVSSPCYRGTVFHRVVKDFCIQGGDYEHGDGTGGSSVFPDGDGSFEDESLSGPLGFNRPYMLAMSNRGRKHTNRSQFFVNTVKALWLDGKHTVFGKVLEGVEIVKEIENVGDYAGVPSKTVTIVGSGEMPLKPEDKEVHY